MTELFSNTYREDPSDVSSAGLKLLVRGGFIRRIEPGGFAYLPLAARVLRHARSLVAAELEKLGAQEVLLPPPFRERALEVARREISGYRKLPFLMHQIDRDGSANSFHADREDLLGFMETVAEAMRDVLAACRLDPIRAADRAESGGAALRLVCRSAAGSERLAGCPACGYAAMLQAAATGMLPDRKDPELLPIEEVATPGRESIADVAAFLGLPEYKAMKAVFYDAGGKLVFACIRGDIEVNEAKLSRLLGVSNVAIAGREILQRHGIVAGYASPLGLPPSIRVVADRTLLTINNFVAGANRPGYHFIHVNLGRDLMFDRFDDIGTVCEGDPCPECSAGTLHVEHCTSVVRMSEVPPGLLSNILYLDAAGERKPVCSASFEIHLERILTETAELHRDEHGIRWPRALAPFDVHLVSLARGDAAIHDEAERLYGMLRAARIETLYDDRGESPGVAFNDADLIGCPLRVTVSKKSLQAGGCELKPRNRKPPEIAPQKQAVGFIRTMLEAIEL